MKKIFNHLLLTVFLFVFSIPAFGQMMNLDTVKAQKFDTGKMWSFDYPPIQYFNKTYGLNTDESWFENVRLSALRLPNCTSSFVSEDGLMMTNHHCVRGLIPRVQKEGEDIIKNGFFAKTLEEERKIPNYYVDQLVLIKDVTDEIEKAEAEAKRQSENYYSKPREWNKETRIEFLNRDDS